LLARAVPLEGLGTAHNRDTELSYDASQYFPTLLPIG